MRYSHGDFARGGYAADGVKGMPKSGSGQDLKLICPLAMFALGWKMTIPALQS